MAQPQHPSRSLPEHPDLQHLKYQAKDLLRAGKAATLSEAQLQLARDSLQATGTASRVRARALQNRPFLHPLPLDVDEIAGKLPSPIP